MYDGVRFDSRNYDDFNDHWYTFEWHRQENEGYFNLDEILRFIGAAEDDEDDRTYVGFFDST